MNTQRTKTQNNRIWALAKFLEKTKEDVADDVYRLTGGRTKSTKELTMREANLYLHDMQKMYEELEPRKRTMRSKILHLATACFEWQFYENSPDWQSFNNWMKRNSKHKKLLMRLSSKELQETIDQLEIIKKRKS